MSDYNLRAPAGANKKKRMVGRGTGSGRGTTAGKGHKGQQSRSGRKSYIGFEGGQMPLYRRVAKRGFSNYPFKKEFEVINLSRLENVFADGETVNMQSLREKGLVSGNKDVKILGNGEITKKLKVEVASLSKSAREKLEKAGGTVVAVADA